MAGCWNPRCFRHPGVTRRTTLTTAACCGSTLRAKRWSATPSQCLPPRPAGPRAMRRKRHVPPTPVSPDGDVVGGGRHDWPLHAPSQKWPGAHARLRRTPNTASLERAEGHRSSIIATGAALTLFRRAGRCGFRCRWKRPECRAVAVPTARQHRGCDHRARRHASLHHARQLDWHSARYWPRRSATRPHLSARTRRLPPSPPRGTPPATGAARPRCRISPHASRSRREQRSDVRRLVEPASSGSLNHPAGRREFDPACA